MMMMMMMMMMMIRPLLGNEILKERIDEILQMSKEISHSDLVYDSKGPTPSMNFGKYGDPVYAGI